MDKIIKTIPAKNGELFAVSAGQRLPLAHFDGRVEIVETTRLVPILGMVQKGVKTIRASFIVCGDLDYQREEGAAGMHSGMVYEASAEIGPERVWLAGLRFRDSDPIKNELVFEIADLELVQKLIR